jgi:uroporphyrin-III C-methyltransferase/precorrin-2 dehydrogenase/sirohydrochlorin ferrochelatase
MAGFPIFVEMGERSPLVVGGGELALLKAHLLLKRAAVVDIAADAVCAGLRDLAASGRVRLFAGSPDEPLIRGRPLVISATADDAEDARVAQIARAIGVPVNVPDRAHLSSFILPAIVDRGTVTVAIGTDGAAPVLATRLRSWLEAELHPRLGHLADIARSYRGRVAAALPSAKSRRQLWERVFAGPAAEAILQGDEEKGRDLIEAALARTEKTSRRFGRVALVGAGPGAADLITIRAVRALKAADVVIHDGLMGEAVLDHARREARLISVAKARGFHQRSQAEINALMIAFAREGNNVVRLKGGDPSLFSRIGEEIDALRAAGIPIEVIPGITAASAAAASLQIPLTHREIARSLVFLSGHSASNGTLELDHVDLESFAGKPVTLAVYMGLATASQLARELMLRGWSPAVPVLAISRISQDNERRILTSLDEIANRRPLQTLSGPTLLIVGEVASLNASISLDRAFQISEHTAARHEALT